MVPRAKARWAPACLRRGGLAAAPQDQEREYKKEPQEW
jgi:hypothetical protein